LQADAFAWVLLSPSNEKRIVPLPLHPEADGAKCATQKRIDARQETTSAQPVGAQKALPDLGPANLCGKRVHQLFN
jgi:hypothetical protein